MTSFPRLAQSTTGQRASNNLSFSDISRSTQNGSSNDPLQPLRAMADRVGKEVEKFAERVDEWHTHANETKKTRYDTTVKMVGKFRDLADTTVKDLAKQNEGAVRGEHAKSIRRRVENMGETVDGDGPSTFGRSSHALFPSTAASPGAQDLRQWQAELATWELLRIIIDHYHPDPERDIAAEKRDRLKNVGGAQRYCPNAEIWERFLLEDDQAKEKSLVLRWLEQTMRNSKSDKESIQQEVDARAGKGASTWTSGWLDTKAKIKQAKRMQGQSKLLEPDSVHLKTSDRVHDLVTQLDPDAPARQKRVLEEADKLHENGFWLICYEEMRRGTPMKEINNFFEERNESWRGVSIGAAYDSHPEGGPNVSGPNVGYMFRRMCFIAAKGAKFPYERAVYGLLSGDIDKVEPVCRTWDEHLYVYYNALLLSRFDSYLQQEHPKKVPEELSKNFVFQDAVALFGNWVNSSELTMDRLRQNKKTTAEAESPMKLIQSALLSGTVFELMVKVGTAVSRMLVNDERFTNLMIDPDTEQGGVDSKPGPEPKFHPQKCYEMLAKDPNALRLLVHIYISLRGLDVLKLDVHPQMSAVGNVLAAYIEFLRLTRRMQLIPLYASQLENLRGIHCLCRILPDIKNSEEQQRMVNLMEGYGLDTGEVISQTAILHSVNMDLYTTKDKGQTRIMPHQITRYVVLEPTPEGDESFVWPGQRIKTEFPGMDVRPEEDRLIETLRWYHYVPYELENTFEQLGDALQVFLLNGRLAAAERLMSEMSLETLSLAKTQSLCGYPFDFMQDGAPIQNTDELDRLLSDPNTTLRRSAIPSPEQHAEIVRELRTEAAPYADLQPLVRMLSLLRDWRAEEDALIAQRRAGHKVSTKRIKSVFEALTTTFSDLVSVAFTLSRPRDPDIAMIHSIYLPELVLAYLCVLTTGAFFIHREGITGAMDVATLVADDESRWVQQCFMLAGRMDELVGMLAKVSKAMCQLGDEGVAMGKMGGRGKRGGKGETVRIWDLNVRN